MIDPDVGRSVESDGIASPNILRVQVPDLKVLNDHIVRASGHSESLASDHAVSAHTYDALVTSDLQRVRACFVVGDGGGGCTGLLSLAPVPCVDCQLTRRAGSVGGASDLRRSALGASEVEGLGDDDVERS